MSRTAGLSLLFIASILILVSLASGEEKETSIADVGKKVLKHFISTALFSYSCNCKDEKLCMCCIKIGSENMGRGFCLVLMLTLKIFHNFCFRMSSASKIRKTTTNCL